MMWADLIEEYLGKFISRRLLAACAGTWAVMELTEGVAPLYRGILVVVIWSVYILSVAIRGEVNPVPKPEAKGEAPVARVRRGLR